MAPGEGAGGSMLPGGFRLGQKLFFMGANQTLASGDRLTHGQQGEVVGHTILERCHALGMKFSENRQNVYCYIDELSESAPPPLPGGFTMGQELFYTGPSHTFDNGERLTHAQQGEVVGSATSEGDAEGLKMRFRGNKGFVTCFPEELSASAPPPLPGGYILGQALFYTGPSHTFGNGERLTHAQRGEVVGPATSEDGAKGLAMRFRGNKGFVTCYPEELSASAPPPLPGGYALGQALFYMGPSRVLEEGNQLTYGQRAVVVGPATLEGTKGTKGLAMRFPGIKDSWVACYLDELSTQGRAHPFGAELSR